MKYTTHLREFFFFFQFEFVKRLLLLMSETDVESLGNCD